MNMETSRVAIIPRNCVLKGQILDPHVLVLHLHYSASYNFLIYLFYYHLLFWLLDQKPYVKCFLTVQCKYVNEINQVTHRK